MTKYDDLNKLEDLRQRGVISEEEFQNEKSKILGSGSVCGGTPNGDSVFGMKINNYLMLMHLSQFAGFLIPLMGFVVPIVLWLTNSKNNEEVDRHGKNIANFMLSMIIYTMIAGVLWIIFIGMPLLATLGVLWIIFVIKAAIKASRGEYWKYPLSITFFS